MSARLKSSRSDLPLSCALSVSLSPSLSVSLCLSRCVLLVYRFSGIVVLSRLSAYIFIYMYIHVCVYSHDRHVSCYSIPNRVSHYTHYVHMWLYVHMNKSTVYKCVICGVYRETCMWYGHVAYTEGILHTMCIYMYRHIYIYIRAYTHVWRESDMHKQRSMGLSIAR